MPVYICQAGSNSSEPWRHGLQVYAAPFQLADLNSGDSRDGHDNVCTVAPRMVSSTEVAGTAQTQRDNPADNYNHDPQQPQRERQQFQPEDPFVANSSSDNNNFYRDHQQQQQQHIESLRFGLPVRRIRHAEVVLVDDVCIAYDRHWLRLRWPGRKGGFAGYVALGKVNEISVSRQALDVLQIRGMSCLVLVCVCIFCLYYLQCFVIF